MRTMTTAASEVSQQIKSITEANIEHSAGAVDILERLAGIRNVANRSAEGVDATLAETKALLSEADEIAAHLNGSTGAAATTRKSTRSRRPKTVSDVAATTEASGERAGSSE